MISVIEKFEKEQIGEIGNENSQMEISLGNSTANNGYELNNSKKLILVHFERFY